MDILQIYTDSKEAYYIDEDKYIKETYMERTTYGGNHYISTVDSIEKIKCDSIEQITSEHNLIGYNCYTKDYCVFIPVGKVKKVYFKKD